MTMPRRLSALLTQPAGQTIILIVAGALFLALTLRVNAVRSEVHHLERQIVAVEHQRLLLETEFETRASQRQLSTWNEVEFGFQAPKGDQFVEGERQLASYGVPAGHGAPRQIRLAGGTPAPASQGALADLARVLDSEPVERGRLEFGRALAVLSADEGHADSERIAAARFDTARLAERLTAGTRGSTAIGTRLVRSGE
ncbi:hypothetical protein [Porphyrobacter sp. GA68]|uniref:hypothetical protein n=1 Tax=Porphyrobacter sp. GA68 TaxID=2883480 RepID=UPI001D18C060|nr:hypothetical protein [Porphyrobacter sp. GA68]